MNSNIHTSPTQDKIASSMAATTAALEHARPDDITGGHDTVPRPFALDVVHTNSGDHKEIPLGHVALLGSEAEG